MHFDAFRILRLGHPSQDLRLCDTPLSIARQADLTFRQKKEKTKGIGKELENEKKGKKKRKENARNFLLRTRRVLLTLLQIGMVSHQLVIDVIDVIAAS